MKTEPIPETGTCSLCGKPYEHWGNNPQPVMERYEARVCDQCNFEWVLPARTHSVRLRFAEARAIRDALASWPKGQEILNDAMNKIHCVLGTWAEAKAQQEAAHEVQELVERIRPLLAGHSPPHPRRCPGRAAHHLAHRPLCTRERRGDT